MAEKQGDANDVDNNPETNDAEGATAAATTPVRRQNDQRRRNSNDAATACEDLLERRDPTAELRSGDAGQAVSDEAASTSRPTNKPEASADDRWAAALALPRTERAERRAEEREERLRETEVRREERQAHQTADVSAVHDTADRSVTEEQSARVITVGNNETGYNTGTVAQSAQQLTTRISIS